MSNTSCSTSRAGSTSAQDSSSHCRVRNFK
jgi:hypothetical protein